MSENVTQPNPERLSQAYWILQRIRLHFNPKGRLSHLEEEGRNWPRWPNSDEGGRKSGPPVLNILARLSLMALFLILLLGL